LQKSNGQLDRADRDIALVRRLAKENAETDMNATTLPGKREPAVSLRGVTKTFDSFFTRALIEASFDVGRGEVFALLGPAGSGKTTTLRILSGQLRPTEGTVKVFGRSPWRAASRRRIGFSPAAREAQKRQPGWAQFLTSWFGGGKSGVEGRLDLKQALLGGRDCILLDEPFAALDAIARTELCEVLNALAGQGKTVIFSSQSLLDAWGFGGRVAIYHEGRIRAVGTLDQLLTAPAALGYLAPILPEVLVRELLSSARSGLASAAGKLPDTIFKAVGENAPDADALQSLSAPAIPPAASPPASGAGEAVDHQKLDDLTRPKPGH
jgi:ABC-2 type transport system ATP-binding protein